MSSQLVFFGVVVSAIAGVVVSHEDARCKNGLRALIIIGAVISAIGALWSSYEQTTFQNLLRDKSAKIERLNEQLLGELTGGEGYTVVNVANFRRKDRLAQLVIQKKGNFPLYDVNFLIADIYAYRHFKNNGFSEEEAMFKSTIRIGPVNLADVVFLPDKAGVSIIEKSVKLGITVTARNGSWFQELRAQVINGRWVQAYRVKSFAGELREKKVDEKYPLNPGEAEDSIWKN